MITTVESLRANIAPEETPENGNTASTAESGGGSSKKSGKQNQNDEPAGAIDFIASLFQGGSDPAPAADQNGPAVCEKETLAEIREVSEGAAAQADRHAAQGSIGPDRGHETHGARQEVQEAQVATAALQDKHVITGGDNTNEQNQNIITGLIAYMGARSMSQQPGMSSGTSFKSHGSRRSSMTSSAFSGGAPGANPAQTQGFGAPRPAMPSLNSGDIGVSRQITDSLLRIENIALDGDAFAQSMRDMEKTCNLFLGAREDMINQNPVLAHKNNMPSFVA